MCLISQATMLSNSTCLKIKASNREFSKNFSEGNIVYWLTQTAYVQMLNFTRR